MKTAAPSLLLTALGFTATIAVGQIDTNAVGNVGVGPSPNIIRPLTVRPATDTEQFVLEQSNDPTSGWALQAGTSGSLAFKRYAANSLMERVTMDSQGSLGIGRLTPNAKLHVYLPSGGAVARFESSVNNDGQSYVYNNTVNTLSIWGAYDYAGSRYAYIGTESNHPFAFISNNVERLRISESGCIGIGTTTPGTGTASVGEKLDIEGGYMRLGNSNGPFLNFYHPNAGTNLKFTRVGSIGGDLYFDSINDAYTTPLTRLFVQNTSGNVGIGTTNPTQKLSVNGTVRAKEVIVETSGWSDYVFADNYTLQPLAEVEEHIKEHKHLPGIPSAQQVSESGIGLGEMQAKLLAKIEELTLHQIEQEKEIHRLNDEVRQIPVLQAELAKLRK